MPTRSTAVYGLATGPRRPNKFATSVIATVPIGYWRLGESNSATVAVDEMGNYNGSYSGGTRGTTPLRTTTSTSQTVTDASTGMAFPSMPAMSSWTIAWWCKATTLTNFTFWVTFGPSVAGQLVRFGTIGSLRYSEGTGWSTGSTPIALNEIGFYAASYGGSGSVSFYKNGTLTETIGSRVNIGLTAGTWTGLPGGSSGGQVLQDVAVWNRVLDASTIKALYLAGV